jgi:HAD domain in Swiss Army Knife RNA repair proteins
VATSRPLLLVDVDGVISLFGFAPHEQPAGAWTTVDGQLHLLSATAGEHLRRLAQTFELAWCTGWEERANEYLPHALALPGPLPHLAFDRDPAGPPPPPRAHWKLAGIDAFAGDERALAWIDDAFNDACHAWARARGAPTLLVQTEPATGLDDAAAATLAAWALSPS